MRISLFKRIQEEITFENRPVQNSVYGIYSLEGVSYLAQLRVSQNKFSDHTFKHNCAETMCPANNDIEDT